ncbi:MAG: DUF4410 domain-containing protein [Nibricoccus sp.]
MKKSFRFALSLLLLGLFVLPAGLSAREKKDYKVQVVIDRGLEGKTQDEQNQLNQVGERLEAYVIEIFKDNGVTATMIPSRDKFDPAVAPYLLIVKMVRYNAGSKATRMVVGFGAGAASLDIHYELFGAEKDPLLTKDHGRGSSRDWTYVCRTLGKDIYKDVDAAISAKKEPSKPAPTEKAK